MDILLPPGLPARQTQFLCLLAARPSLTRADYQHLAGISPRTAKRDLTDLVDRGLVLPIGGGRTRRYALHPTTRVPANGPLAASSPVPDQSLIRVTIEPLTVTTRSRRA